MYSVRAECELASAYHEVRDCPERRKQFLSSLSEEEFQIVLGFAALMEETLRMKMFSKRGQKLASCGLDLNRGNWSEVLTVLALLAREFTMSGASPAFVPEAVSYGDWLLRPDGADIVNEKTASRIGIRDVMDTCADLRRALLEGKGTKLGNGSIAVLEALGLVSPDTGNSGKSDITIWRAGESLGVSNKSFVGSEPSLFNYSQAAALAFDVLGLTKKDVSDLGGTRPRQWRLELSARNGTLLGNGRFTSAVFEQNLCQIDPDLPKLYMAMHRQYVLSGTSCLAELVRKVGGDERLLRAFSGAVLSDVTAARKWDGIRHELLLSVVDKTGNVSVYDDGQSIEDYLVPRMKFDVPSQSRSNNGFSWDDERNCAVLTVGLQIRLNANPIK